MCGLPTKFVQVRYSFITLPNLFSGNSDILCNDNLWCCFYPAIKNQDMLGKI